MAWEGRAQHCQALEEDQQLPYPSPWQQRHPGVKRSFPCSSTQTAPLLVPTQLKRRKATKTGLEEGRGMSLLPSPGPF